MHLKITNINANLLVASIKHIITFGNHLFNLIYGNTIRSIFHLFQLTVRTKNVIHIFKQDKKRRNKNVFD